MKRNHTQIPPVLPEIPENERQTTVEGEITTISSTEQFSNITSTIRVNISLRFVIKDLSEKMKDWVDILIAVAVIIAAAVAGILLRKVILWFRNRSLALHGRQIMCEEIPFADLPVQCDEIESSTMGDDMEMIW